MTIASWESNESTAGGSPAVVARKAYNLCRRKISDYKQLLEGPEVLSKGPGKRKTWSTKKLCELKIKEQKVGSDGQVYVLVHYIG